VTRSVKGLSLAEGWRLSGLTGIELWLKYFGVGGNATAAEVKAYTLGWLSPDWYEHNLIALAINETLLDAGLSSAVAYRDDGPGGCS
jgi:hypothetical protein